MTTATLNPNVPFVIKSLTALAVGAVIRAGSGGDAAKEAAKAQTVIGVANGVLQLNDGDVVDGLNAIDAAVATGNVDPAEEIAIQTAIAWVETKATAAQNFFGGTVGGLLAAQISTAVANEAVIVAQAYIPAKKAGAEDASEKK